MHIGKLEEAEGLLQEALDKVSFFRFIFYYFYVNFFFFFLLLTNIYLTRFFFFFCLSLSLLLQDNSDPDTLVNLITVSLQLNKSPELVTRFINQLKDEAPNHPFTKSYVSNEKNFERAAAQFSAEASA